MLVNNPMMTAIVKRAFCSGGVRDAALLLAPPFIHARAISPGAGTLTGRLRAEDVQQDLGWQNLTTRARTVCPGTGL
jgi:hypothetical protein